MAELPHREFTSCSYRPRDNLVEIQATGTGEVEPHERFTISANGATIEMVVVSITWPPIEWTAVNWASFVRDNSTG